MKFIARGLVGLFGALGLLVMVRLWMAPAQAAGQLGLSGEGLLGLASLRADLAGFFGAVGLLALAAAFRDDRRLLIAPLLMIGLALTGRVLTVAVDGFSQAQVQPMVIETVLLMVFALGRRNLGIRK